MVDDYVIPGPLEYENMSTNFSATVNTNVNTRFLRIGLST
jgi:hypothetical protein